MSGIRYLVINYAKKHGCSFAEAEDVIKKTLDVITDSIVENGGFTYIGQFSIQSVRRKERLGRNPKTKEEFKIPSTVTLRIKCGKLLKKRLNP